MSVGGTVFGMSKTVVTPPTAARRCRSPVLLVRHAGLAEMDVDVDRAGQHSLPAASMRSARPASPLFAERHDAAAVDGHGAVDHAVLAGDATVDNDGVDQGRKQPRLHRLTSLDASVIVHWMPPARL